jgi:hypothetical protein
MRWHEVKTAKQREKLIDATVVEICKLQEIARTEGLLSCLELGDNLFPGSLSDMHSLYLRPNGTLEHRESLRDSMAEDWRSETRHSLNEQELRRIISLCGIDPEGIKAIVEKLTATIETSS